MVQFLKSEMRKKEVQYMIVMSCSNIAKSYIVENILENVSFNINEYDKVGLVGLNGAGKSTLFNILSGEISPDSGTVTIPKNYRIALLEQQLFKDESNTIYDELMSVFSYLEEMEKELRSIEVEMSEKSNDPEALEEIMKRYSNLTERFQEKNGFGYKSEVKGVLRGLGFTDEDFEKYIYELSGGQKARVSLGKILLENPEILLLDEPTNHLDIEAIDWLEKYIKVYKGTVITISHDRYFLDNTVSKILHLENGRVEMYSGNYTEFIKKRKANLEALKRRYENQQKEISSLEEKIRKFEQSKHEKLSKMVKSRKKMLEKMTVMEDPEVTAKKSIMRFEPAIQSGNDVLSLENVSVGYDEKKLFEDVSINVYKGDHIGIIGPNGIGKTSLIKSIQGIIPLIEGEIKIGHNVNIGYFDQEQENLDEDKIVMEEIWDEYPKLTTTEIRGLLAKFLFIGDDIYKEISALSGGEKSRLSLLKLMMSKTNLLLMDEPTNHLDIDSKEVLEDAISSYDGTVMVISHDRYFLNKISDKIWEMDGKGLKEYLGNYDYYLEKKEKERMKAENIEDENEMTKTQLNAIKKKEREKQKQKSAQRKKVKNLEKEIEETENKIMEFESELCKEEVYSDHEKSLEINSEMEKLKKKLEKIYDEWMLLNEDGDE